MILMKIDGVWTRMTGDCDVARMVDERICLYHDGRRETEKCDPYPVADRLNMEKVDGAIRDGIWTDEDLGVYNLIYVEQPVAPEGQRFVEGAPMGFVEGKDGRVTVVIDVEDIPPPPAPPTLEEKLQVSFGMTKAELIEALKE